MGERRDCHALRIGRNKELVARGAAVENGRHNRWTTHRKIFVPEERLVNEWVGFARINTRLLENCAGYVPTSAANFCTVGLFFTTTSHIISSSTEIWGWNSSARRVKTSSSHFPVLLRLRVTLYARLQEKMIE